MNQLSYYATTVLHPNETGSNAVLSRRSRMFRRKLLLQCSGTSKRGRQQEGGKLVTSDAVSSIPSAEGHNFAFFSRHESDSTSRPSLSSEAHNSPVTQENPSPLKKPKVRSRVNKSLRKTNSSATYVLCRMRNATERTKEQEQGIPVYCAIFQTNHVKP
jgi:hypothetical protein